NDDRIVTREYFIRDIERLQDAFRDQIRSYGIVEYYPVDLIYNCIKKCGLKFALYTPSYPLIPSFRNVYKKGFNLSKAYIAANDKSNGEKRPDNKKDDFSRYISWYMEAPNNDLGKVA